MLWYQISYYKCIKIFFIFLFILVQSNLFVLSCTFSEPVHIMQKKKKIGSFETKRLLLLMFIKQSNQVFFYITMFYILRGSFENFMKING